MYNFSSTKLVEVLSNGGHFSEVVKRAVETYLTCDTEFLTQVPQLTKFLLDIGVLETTERNVSHFKFLKRGPQEN